MKFFIVLVILSSFLFSKECYFNKVNEICYYKYFKKSNIHEFKADEEYYINKDDRIYAIDKVIEVRFNSIGAVFTILNDFELEFVDKIRKEVYLFQVEDRRDLFTTISKLNKLKTIMKAQPHMQRKYTKSHIRSKIEAKKARLDKVLNKAQRSLNNKKGQPSTKKKHVGFNVPEAEEKEEKSFMKGNTQ